MLITMATDTPGYEKADAMLISRVPTVSSRRYDGLWIVASVIYSRLPVRPSRIDTKAI